MVVEYDEFVDEQTCNNAKKKFQAKKRTRDRSALSPYKPVHRNVGDVQITVKKLLCEFLNTLRTVFIVAYSSVFILRPS